MAIHVGAPSPKPAPKPAAPSPARPMAMPTTILKAPLLAAPILRATQVVQTAVKPQAPTVKTALLNQGVQAAGLMNAQMTVPAVIAANAAANAAAAATTANQPTATAPMPTPQALGAPPTATTSTDTSGGPGGGGSSGGGQDQSTPDDSQPDDTQAQQTSQQQPDDGSGDAPPDDGTATASDGSAGRWIMGPGGVPVQIDPTTGRALNTPDQTQADAQAQAQPQDSGYQSYLESQVMSLQQQIAAQTGQTPTPAAAVAQAAPQAAVQGFGAENANPRFSAYVQDGKLCAFAIVSTPWGTTPIFCTAPVRTTSGAPPPNGAVQIGVDASVDNAVAGAKGQLMNGAAMENQRLMAISVAKRARLGDQNAMGIIAELRRSDNAVARYSLKCIIDWLQANPIAADGTFTFSAESILKAKLGPDPYPGIMRLANGPAITNNRVRAMSNTYGGRQARRRKAFQMGVEAGAEPTYQDIMDKLDAMEKKLFQIGQCVGAAAAIQQVRAGAPISTMSQRAAWELGE